MVVAHGGSIAWGQVGSLAEGTLVGWGVYPDSESPRPAQTVVPAGTFIAIAAGADHSLGMRSDGTLAGWGYNDWGQATVPAGTFAAISGGTDHSIGLRPNGTVVGWGRNLEGQITIPAGTFTIISAGWSHSLGVRTDGTLAGWGNNFSGQTTFPSGTFAAVAAGGNHSLGVRSDGTLAGWGRNVEGQTTVPTGTFTAIGAGVDHSLAVRSDGTLFGWGSNNFGQATVPTGTFMAVAAGDIHSLGLRPDGTLAGWGHNGSGKATVPAGTFTAVAAGWDYSIALRGLTHYSGDLLVSGSGARTNLNRSVTVAGNASIVSTMNLYNLPTLNVAGKLCFGGTGHVIGDGSISAGAIEILPGANALLTGNLNVNSGPLTGNGALALEGGAHLTAALSNLNPFTGALNVGTGPFPFFTGIIGFTGTGVINPAWLSVSEGSEVRLGAGQRMVVGSFGALNSGRIELIGNGSVLGGTSEIEFRSGLFNTPSGFVSARNALMRVSSGTLLNYGTIGFSFGTSDVFGDVTNSGKVIISGNSAATFNDDVVNDFAGEFRVSTGSTAVFFGAVRNDGAFTGGGTKFFEGSSLGVMGALETSGKTVVASGASVTATRIREASLTVEGEVTISPDGTAVGTSRFGALSIDGGTLALNDNDVIVDYGPGAPSPEFTLRDLVLRARDVGDTGIFSTATAEQDTVLAFGEASELAISDFNDSVVDATTVVGKYTYYGDANFDGQVTTDDYVAVDLGLGTGDSWVQGDFDLNGVVTTDDYVVVDLNLGKGTDNPLAYAEEQAAMIALHTEMFGPSYVEKLAYAQEHGWVAASVPEPGVGGLLAITAVAVTRRRRRAG
jgi:hypothetical protein